ncbi:MAG TPA: hypothetical protein VHC21_00215 [Candidatus Saccharimonadales bacterium]|nr:hypothetical protein [Candidatus Saccharimonadales bacterium]
MPPDEPNDEEKLEKLPEDGDTPAALPTPSRDDPADENLDREIRGERETKDYPQQDDDQDFEELYNEGAEVEEPNAGNTVEGYDPAKDQRRHKE